MSINLLFDEEKRAGVEEAWTRWWAGDLERWDSKVAIAHGGLGTPGVQSLSSLRTTKQLLYDLIDSPDEIIRLSREMTDVSIRHYEISYGIVKKSNRGTTDWASIWSPERYHMHQCDFSCMISSPMFDRFVMPDLDKLIRQTNHAFYHLDGPDAVHHLDALLSLEKLLGIQWVPGAGQPQAPEWIPLLKRIRDGGKLCQVHVDPAGALKIVRELGGRGFCFLISQWAGQMSPEEIDAFLAQLGAEDAAAA